MSRSRILSTFVAVGVLSAVGCQSPRIVKIDQQGAVVAMPKNTNTWPTYYRSKAEALLAQRFPNGYDIVDEEEFVTGQQEHTNSHTDINEKPKLLLGGADTSTKPRGNGIRQVSALGGLAIPLGETEKKTQSTTTFTDITEYRISVRAK